MGAYTRHSSREIIVKTVSRCMKVRAGGTATTKIRRIGDPCSCSASARRSIVVFFVRSE
jgi:hypothetical protein